jgi:hypothetical protein
MPTLSQFIKIVAFDDTNQTNAPKLQSINWNRDTLQGIPVEAPSNNEYTIPALASRNVFDGTRTLEYDATTQFSVVLSGLDPNRYRLTWTGGTDPGFRQARTVNVSGGSLIFVVNTNQTVVVTHTAGAVFGNVQAGDDLFIPGASTGDTGPFSTLNEGHWVVLAASTTSLTIVRETGLVFSGLPQTVVVTNNSQFLVFSSDGVQVDDVVMLLSGFYPALLHSYEILEVTSKFVEFESSSPLPNQTTIPGDGSMVVFDQAKRWLYLETNQEVQLTINGVSLPPVTPFLAGDDGKVGTWMAASIIYSMVISNNSTQQARVRVISVE